MLGPFLRVEKREAISLAPWLQPGGQVLQNDSLNRFQRFRLILQPTKTVRNGSLSMPVYYHRAEATVLIRSLSRPPPAFSVKAVNHSHLLENSYLQMPN
jgi:hypothetical protein